MAIKKGIFSILHVKSPKYKLYFLVITIIFNIILNNNSNSEIKCDLILSYKM